jgi:hypothetical protein
LNRITVVSSFGIGQSEILKSGAHFDDFAKLKRVIDIERISKSPLNKKANPSALNCSGLLL